ncbi:MAG: hypothetical protein ACRES9_09885 [Gammaproteobacteria bacterium]
MRDEAWQPAVEAGPDGLTPFQQQTLERLRLAVKGISLQQYGPGQGEAYLKGPLPGTEATVFVYTDGAEICVGSKTLFSGERWDYVSPDELIESFVSAVRNNAT